jgi:hypothetical protein
MKIEELRIGNLVKNGLGEFIIIKNNINERNTGGYILKTLEPIPITEEWLIRFKFKTQADGFLYKNLKRKGTRLEVNMKKKLICMTRNGIPMDVVHLQYIKQVHQLQNLYFALTGCELQYVA